MHDLDRKSIKQFQRYMESKGPKPDNYKQHKVKKIPESFEEIQDKLVAVQCLNLELASILDMETFKYEEFLQTKRSFHEYKPQIFENKGLVSETLNEAFERLNFSQWKNSMLLEKNSHYD